MAWTASKIFSAYPTDKFNNTTLMDANSNTVKVALFNDSATPSQTAASASTAYGAGAWAANGVSDASGWPAAGRTLVVTTSAFSSNVYTLDADDTVSANASTTLTNAFGCLIYDDTIATPVADQGMCYNFFGGANSVTSGTFTVVWNASGVLALTL